MTINYKNIGGFTKFINTKFIDDIIPTEEAALQPGTAPTDYIHNLTTVYLKEPKTNKYLVAESNGDLNANRDIPAQWEQFEIQQITGDGILKTGDKVALKSVAHQTYVVSEPNGQWYADRFQRQEWETFMIMQKIPGSATSGLKPKGSPILFMTDVLFRSVHSGIWKYLSAEQGGTTVSRSYGTTEGKIEFQIIPVNG